MLLLWSEQAELQFFTKVTAWKRPNIVDYTLAADLALEEGDDALVEQ